MRFNFPKKECVLIHLKFDMDTFEQIKDIGEREEVLRVDAVMTLLKAAIEEYYKGIGKKKPTRQGKSYPAPIGKENSPDEDFSNSL